MNNYWHIAFRYMAAGALAYITAHPAAWISLAFYGFPDAGNELLSATMFVAFASVGVGGLFFPKSFRWFRSAILLGCGLLLYCAPDYARANDPYFPPIFPYPLFVPLMTGGLIAVGLHALIELFQRTRRSSATGLKPAAA